MAFDSRLTEYANTVEKQRDSWMHQWVGREAERLKAEQSHIRMDIEHLMTIKQVVDDAGRDSVSGHDVAMTILTSPKYEDYLVKFFKGRGDFHTHFGAVLRAMEHAVGELRKSDNYKVVVNGPCWEASKL